MKLKDQIAHLADRLQTVPSLVTVKIAKALVKPALSYWEAETVKAEEAARRAPAAEKAEADAKYQEAFVHWHRLNFLFQRIEEAEKFQSFDAPRFQRRVGEKAPPPQKAAGAESAR